MGITIDVESMITPFSRRRPGPKETYDIQRHYVELVCDNFGWEKIPWNEPSEQRGISASANSSRYFLLLFLARVFQFSSEEALYSDDSVRNLAAQVQSKAFMPLMSENFYDDPYLRFVHFLDHDVYESIYIPIDFETPRHITTVVYGGNDSISVGSSLKLGNEMEILDKLISRIIGLKGEETIVQPDSGILHKWADVHDLCLTFQQAARESKKLNLPIRISW
jgi:hypothetical protein